MNFKPHPYVDVDVDADDNDDDDDDDQSDDDDHENDDHDDHDDNNYDDHNLFTFGGTLCILKRLFHTLVFTSVLHISWGTPIN